MKILYTVALVSFAALAWAAFAIVRHIRKGAAGKPVDSQESDLSHLLEARLQDISKHPPGPAPEATPLTEQDFSYFNRDPSGDDYPVKPTPPVERSHPATDHR